MFTERTSVGLDVHARSVAASAIDGVTGELFQKKLPPGNGRILERVRTLPGPVAVFHEAGPTGFGLQRALTAAGMRCLVAAPLKLHRPSGDWVKTDARDAVHLARLLRLDEIAPVTVPTVDQEAARDLVRPREDCRGDLMRARHRLSKLLLRPGSRACRGGSPRSATATCVGCSSKPPGTTPCHHVGAMMRGRGEQAPAAARARGDLGNRRLHDRWVQLIERRKRPTIANIAIARELAGWCWSLAVIDG